MKLYKNIPFSQISLTGGFWADRCRLNREVSIPSVYERFEDTGRMDALRFVYGKKEHPLHIYYDSDVAKWIEAVAYQYMRSPRGMGKYIKVIDRLVAAMKKNQREDGYLNSYFQQKEPEHIYEDRNRHELYCSGHLIEAAIAYHLATGKREFLDMMEKNVACIKRAFFTEGYAAFHSPGHQEIELSLVKLYRHTGKAEYLEMAKGFIENRGKYPGEGGVHDQSETDLRHMTRIHGHSVRALYYLTGAADVAAETQDEELALICKQLFTDIQKKTYITGGFGSDYRFEGFTVPYDLPNREAYSESCACIAMLYFVERLQAFGPKGEYGDMAETVMYNNLLSSTSVSGDAFFYENPLEIDRRYFGRNLHNPGHKPIFERVKVFGCSCCPPNINRIFATLPGLFFTESEETLYVNQYVSCKVAGDFGKIALSTRYPIEGKIRITLSDFKKKVLALRLPAFAEGKYRLEGAAFVKEEAGYLFVTPEKEEILFTLPLAAEFVEADPRVHDDCGRVALRRGPVVYCAEQKDNGENLNALAVDLRRRPKKEAAPASLKTPFPALVAEGTRDREFAGLYRRARGESTPTKVRFIPYYLFANRGASDMQVFLRKK